MVRRPQSGDGFKGQIVNRERAWIRWKEAMNSWDEIWACIIREYECTVSYSTWWADNIMCSRLLRLIFIRLDIQKFRVTHWPCAGCVGPTPPLLQSEVKISTPSLHIHRMYSSDGISLHRFSLSSRLAKSHVSSYIQPSRFHRPYKW